MPNQHTTVQRIRNFIAEENFIAYFTYNQHKKCFRLVMRWKNGQDHLTYLIPSKIGQRTFYETYCGVSDYGLSWNHKGASFATIKVIAADIDERSTLELVKQMLNTYGRRYTRPAYYNVDGTTKCKYTQEQLDNKEF